MHRQVLIQGFIRLFVPLVVGTLGSVIVGVSVGMLTGLGAHHTFFYIVIPIVSGGIGEGMYTPWGDVISALTPAYALTVTCTVLSMIASGFFIGKYMKMYPVEAAIVTACHSGLGGTGDVAILSASNRMEMMSFAQVATRLGGASMVVLAAILLRIWH